MTPPIDLASRFTAAVEAADEDALRACLSPDLVVWHNNGNVTHELEQVVRMLLWVNRRVDGLHYDDVVRQTTERGYVQQHALRGTLPDGAALVVHACLVVTVDGDRITRIDEYIDEADVHGLFAR